MINVTQISRERQSPIKGYTIAEKVRGKTTTLGYNAGNGVGETTLVWLIKKMPFNGEQGGRVSFSQDQMILNIPDATEFSIRGTNANGSEVKYSRQNGPLVLRLKQNESVEVMYLPGESGVEILFTSDVCTTDR